jgi:hypothetical protein
MNVLSLYTALLVLLFVVLSIRTLRLRGRLRIALGDAGNEEMLRAMRVHSNFAEYVPLSLIALYLAVSQGAAEWIIHALCLCLLLGRLSHAYGVSQVRENLSFRVAGMAMTFITLVSASVYLLYSWLKSLL